GRRAARTRICVRAAAGRTPSSVAMPPGPNTAVLRRGCSPGRGPRCMRSARAVRRRAGRGAPGGHCAWVRIHRGDVIVYTRQAIHNGQVAKHSLLAVFSHPDDETIVSPLLAKYAHEDHAVHLLTLTAGEKGIRKHARIPAGQALAAIRAQELACSDAKLGL